MPLICFISIDLNSSFPLPTSHHPSSQLYAFDNKNQVTYSGYQKDSNSSFQPTSSQIRGNLAYTNSTYQSSGGLNAVSPIVTISEKFAGACYIANPMTLVDSFWYFDNGATDHVVADGGCLLNET
ncbi:hypothetical protein FEM48_Zijuj01G0276200 [Ziziphus jujuba var. spinosa]|uniref:Uncharacterized protein n=1 Tax=Ziziphus jujuba var. spinosa TaxID=714518 RepID=A0A978W593_ZIZJJ|nr:hypothetical protein FEM48_Zijuj01G0276200 [Ziziphus jujuba var. spinosa]